MRIVFGRKLEDLIEENNQLKNCVNDLENELSKYKQPKKYCIGHHCGVCKNSYTIYNSAMIGFGYGCKLDIPCPKFEDMGCKND